MQQPSSTERERLRRALYRPEASDADRQRWARLARSTGEPATGAAGPGPDAEQSAEAGPDAVGPEAALDALSEVDGAGAPAARPARGPAVRRPGARVLMALVGVAGLGLLAWPVAAGSTSTPAPSATPQAARTAWQPDVQRGDVLYTDAGVVQEFHGSGPATAVLDGDLLPQDGGRLSVALGSSATASIGWQVRRTVPVDGASDQLIAARSTTERRSAAVPVDVPFSGAPPDRVRVDAPTGVAWSLTVTALQGATPR